MVFGKRKKKILVADNDIDFLSVVEAILEHAGYAIDTAEDGEEALKAIRKQKYDLLVLDTGMSRIDGIKLFQLARKSGSYSKTPVLLVSGQSNGEWMKENEKETIGQADGYIWKPIKTKTFLEKVRTLIERKDGK